jgi:hypothetical protein
MTFRWEELETDRPAEAPAEMIQARLARIWAGVLGQPGPSVDDNFFDIAGNSLLAIRLTSTLRTELGVEVLVHIVVDYPTVRSMAGLIQASG